MTPEKRARENARLLAYYYRTKESRLAIRRGYEAKARKQNPEKFRAKWRNQYSKNPIPKLASGARYRVKHRTKVLAAKKKWQADNWAHRQAYAVKYYATHGEKIKQRRLVAYHANPAVALKRQKEYLNALPPEEIQRKKQVSRVWVIANRERMRPRLAAHAARRRAIKLAVTVGAKEIDAWMVKLRGRSGVKCYYCTKPIAGSNIHFDHIVPLSKGGPHELTNLAASCCSCNSSKNAKMLGVWNVKSGQQVLSL